MSGELEGISPNTPGGGLRRTRSIWFTASLLMGAAAVVALTSCHFPGASQESASVDYNWDVRPILSNNCFHCHGPDAKARKAGLRLDDRKVATGELPETKGKHAIVPGDPSRSELIRRITSTDPDVRMPPPAAHEKLSAGQVQTLTRWIEEGAQYKPHWAFIAPARTSPPRGRFESGAINDIDRFVRARLEKEGLSPAPEADKVTLVNRVTFSLTGLPPTPGEVDAFLADRSPDAYEKLVDRLLASPAYGERMASEWLDAARFADSDGYLDDDYGRLLYPWRDWVIGAFNSNLPYDQFGTWQLAGDLLPGSTKAQRLATAFGRLHRRTGENGIIDEEYRVEYVIDRTDTLGTAFLGLSVGCARCHDHKFDPISHVDYYSLTAFFNSTDDAGFYPQQKWGTGPILLMTDDAQDQKIAALRKQIATSMTSEAAALAAARARSSAQSTPAPAATLSLLQAGLDAAQYAYFPFDSAADQPATAQLYKRTAGLEPSEPLWFSPAATAGLRPAVLQGPVFRKGVRGNALFFTASNRGFIDKQDHVGAFDHPDEFSIDFWLYPDKEYEEAAVLNHSDHLRFGSGGWSIDLEHNQLKMQLVHAYPRDQITVVTRGKLPPKTWSHITMTYDGSARAAGITIYIDGKPAAVQIRRDGLTQSIVPLGLDFAGLDGFKGLAFGKRWQQSPLEGGALDELRLFHRNLSPIEVDVLHRGAQALQAGAYEKPLQDYRASLDPQVVEARAQLRALRTDLSNFLTGLPRVMTLGDTDQPRQTFVLNRGVYSNHGEPVSPRGLIQVFPYPASLPKNRLGLARWLFDPKHPLTARVYANRLWQMHFGRGLVRTAEEFGMQGEAPTHPELLDWLAREFIDSGWDIKKLNKQIVMSGTFRQASNMSAAQVESDPDNHLLARGPTRRLTAEMIRDNALAISGLLDRRLGGASVFPYQPPGVWEAVSEHNLNGGYPKPETVPQDQHRRSLYSLIRRGAPVPSMSIFDFPRRHTSTVRRGASNTPLQALVLLNDPQYVEASRGLAQRAYREKQDTDDRLTLMFRLAARRAPSAPELDVVKKFYAGELAAFEKEPDRALQLLKVGVAPLESGADPGHLAALTSTANVLINSPASYMLQ